MENTSDFENDYEDRLLLFHKRCVATLSRKEASDNGVRNALSITQDTRLVRVAVEFTVDGCNDTPHRWPLCDGLGEAIEAYVSSLRHMENVRLSKSGFNGLTDEHHQSLEAVKIAAQELQAVGWPVNWEQNVQAILELTEYGLRGGQLIHRFGELPVTAKLKDLMLSLGSPTFYRQSRPQGERLSPPFKAMALCAANKARYDEVELHRRGEDEHVSDRFQYLSDWLGGGSYRIAI